MAGKGRIHHMLDSVSVDGQTQKCIDETRKCTVSDGGFGSGSWFSAGYEGLRAVLSSGFDWLLNKS